MLQTASNRGLATSFFFHSILVRFLNERVQLLAISSGYDHTISNYFIETFPEVPEPLKVGVMGQISIVCTVQ